MNSLSYGNHPNDYRVLLNGTSNESMEQLRLLAYRSAHCVLDLVVFSLAFALGFITYSVQRFGAFGTEQIALHDGRILLMLFLIFYGANFFFLAYYKLYHSPTLRDRTTTLQLYFNATSMGLFLAALIAFFLPFLAASRVMLLSSGFYAFSLLIIKERLILFVLKRLQSRIDFQRRAVLIGNDPEALKQIRKRCTRDMLVGLNIVGVIKPDDSPIEQSVDEPLGSLSDLGELLDEHCIDIAVIIGDDVERGKLDEAIYTCEERGLETWLHFDLLDRPIYRSSLSDVWGISFLQFQSYPPSALGLLLKAIFDRIGALLILIVLSPLMIAVALLVKLTSPGPIIFVQERAGINGKSFRFLKFRSMYQDAEQRRAQLLEQNENSGPAFKLREDPRITPLGKFIRKSSIDELPQLINVLRGDMSLVGPRPLPLSEVKEFDSWHRRRLSMRPGITGLWQVEGRSNIEDFNDWAQLDLKYIDSWSLSFDFVILLRTIPAVLFMRGAH